MDALDAVDRLAKNARRELAPATNVDIAAIVRSARLERTFVFPLAWSAAASAIAACVVLVISFRTETTTALQTDTAGPNDSVASLFNVVQVEMP